MTRITRAQRPVWYDFDNPADWDPAGFVTASEDNKDFVQGARGTKFVPTVDGIQPVQTLPGVFHADFTNADKFLRIWRRINHVTQDDDRFALLIQFRTDDSNFSRFDIEVQLSGAPHYKSLDERYFKIDRFNPDATQGTLDWSNVNAIALRIGTLPAGRRADVTLDDLSNFTPKRQPYERVGN